MLPKTTVYVKRYDGQTLWMYFFIKDDDLLEKHNTSLHKVMLISKKNLMAGLCMMKIISKPKQNIMTMKLQIFAIKRFLS